MVHVICYGVNSLRCTIVSVLMVLLSIQVVQSAPLRDVPQRLIQPDGEILECFASGDEYHNWLHDENGFTIIRDPESGFYVYAMESAGTLVPTGHIAGRVEPASVGLQPHANIPPEVVMERRTEFYQAMKNATFEFGSLAKSLFTSHSSQTVLHNIVVFIRFSDDGDFEFPIGYYDSLYNTTVSTELSLYNYYVEVSYGSLEIMSGFYPSQTGSVVSAYQDSNPRSYYRPFHETQNPHGYDPNAPATSTNSRTYREHTLLKNAIQYVANQIPPSLAIDANNDGYVDCVSFIVTGGPDGWNTLLWPHRWALWSQEAYIHGKRVWDYTFQLEGAPGGSGLSLGVVAHEMFHVLGAPDLYHYSQDGLHPVGPWDIMAFTYNIPQHMGAYMKHLYGGWIDEIPMITTSGLYELNPLTSPSNNAYRIPSPYSHSEFFVVEYRKRNTAYEQILPGEGLLVYRINIDMEARGNANGPPDEIYVYRPDGTVSTNGDLFNAHFGSHVSRVEMNDFTNPSSFLSDGTAGGLSISSISAPGETITFFVDLRFVPPWIIQYDRGSLYWGIGTGHTPHEFQVAIRIPADEVQEFTGRYMTHTRKFIQSGGGNDVTVRVWEGGMYGNPGTLVYEKNIAEQVVLDSWTDHELESPVEIKAGQEYWVGYRINATGGFPAGIDGGPMVSGKGAWINWSGTWQELTSLNAALNSNFRIRAVIKDILTEVESVTALPERFVLHQNFPNPFNPQTRIVYEIPQRSHVTLEVFNTLGQHVATLVNEEQPAQKYEIIFDGARLPSGVYFYRLTAVDMNGGRSPFAETRRFVLVR